MQAATTKLLVGDYVWMFGASAANSDLPERSEAGVLLDQVQMLVRRDAEAVSFAQEGHALLH